MSVSSLLNLGVQLFPAGAGRPDAPRRLVVVVDGIVPTLELAIRWPLERQFAEGGASMAVLTQARLAALTPGGMSGLLRRWLDRRRPTHLLFCRYGGAHAETLLAEARRRGIPSVYCIDDDLLSVPPELGPAKFERHNAPARQRAIRHLLTGCDRIYCSNARLRARLDEYGIATPVTVPEQFCPGAPLRPPALGPARKIGYFGFDHTRNLALAAAGLAAAMERHPALRFELVGPIALPAALGRFEGRIATLPPVRDYRRFLGMLAGRGWDIGIAPLERSRFNLVKNHNKWIEYASAGIAAVVSRDTIYDECCSDECGLAVADDGWEQGLSALIEDPARRHRLACNAQRKLAGAYRPDRIGDGLIALLDGLNA